MLSNDPWGCHSARKLKPDHVQTTHAWREKAAWLFHTLSLPQQLSLVFMSWSIWPSLKTFSQATYTNLSRIPYSQKLWHIKKKITCFKALWLWWLVLKQRNISQYWEELAIIIKQTNKQTKVCGILELSRRLYYDLWVHLLKSERAMKRKSEVTLQNLKLYNMEDNKS